jgi:hypothetical protein
MCRRICRLPLIAAQIKALTFAPTMSKRAPAFLRGQLTVDGDVNDTYITLGG